MYNGYNSSPTVTNSIFWDNNVNEIYNESLSDPCIAYCNILGCGSSGAGWNAYLGTDNGGNIDADPLFVDAVAGDYHLKSQAGRWDAAANGGAGDWVLDDATSPCIDAGDPCDPVGDESMPNGGRVNMGAYGATAQASRTPWPECWEYLTQCHGDCDGSGDVDTVDWPIFRDAFGYAYPAAQYHPCGDLDHDGDVDTGDWPEFRDNFGYPAAADCPLGGTWPPVP